jgi:hypothetical protein
MSAEKEFSEIAAMMRQQADVTVDDWWMNSAEQAFATPPAPSEVKIQDSTTGTELWKRGAADWQRPSWK